MRGSMIRHKSRLGRFVHHNFNLRGSTMPAWPLLNFSRRHPDARKKLAAALRIWRRQYGRMHDRDNYALW